MRAEPEGQGQSRAGAGRTRGEAARVDERALRAAILAAEDRRADDEAGLAVLRQGLKASPSVQALAVRALGRLERAALVTEIVPLLDASVPAVRIEAANAIGQAVSRGDADLARGPLLARVSRETDAEALAALARTLGRLPYQREADVRGAERAILEIADRAGDATRILLGVSHGLEALARRAAKLGSLGADTRARLRVMARHGLAAPAARDTTVRPQAALPLAARVRRLSVGALVTLRESHVPLLREVLADPDDQVRRLGVLWLGVMDDMPLRDAAFRQAFADASPMVRYEALRTHARTRQTAGDASGADCALELSALDDPQPHVVLLAIDLLGHCTGRREVVDRLTPIASAFLQPRATGSQTAATKPVMPPARGLPADTWHGAAHALVSIARLAPDRASALLATAVTHQIWQMRMYAALAAGVSKDAATLDTLAADAHDNVRNTALEALHGLAGHDADSHALAALDRADSQLVRTAARVLAGTARTQETADRVLKAFVRISAARRETSRDTRLALLDTLADTSREVSSTPASAQPAATPFNAASPPPAPPQASGPPRTRPAVERAVDTLRPFLADFDPRVAARVAALLTAWTGQPHAAAPKPLPRTPVPSPVEIDRLSRTRAVVRLARGGTFTLAFRPDVAPTNAARFVRLARAGYFNGLTIHRVEPNFVVQGGSPGANEYAGDGPFSRDEVDLTSNLRGTVGLSTRGRDTGDAQFFVNLVDNARLDHNYTVFAEVVDGLPIVDAVLEGDVIITRVTPRER